jgi:hypothetical protein
MRLSLDRLVLAYAIGYGVSADGLLAGVGGTKVLMPRAYRYGSPTSGWGCRWRPPSLRRSRIAT